jgi:exopolysaccharide biosynthesis protein
MKIRFLLLAAILFPTINFANSIDSVVVGPGVTHYHQIIDSGPWNINVIKIDIQNSWLKFQSVKAGDKLTAFEKTSSMASRNNFEEHRVVAAINGDFYNTSTGEQIGTQVANGELLKVTGDWLNVAFDIDKNPMIGLQNFSGAIITSDSTKSISGVNKTRGTDELIFYNSFKGSTTSTNQFGTEVRITPIDNWFVNDTIRCIVDTVLVGVGSMSIGTNKAVLSGHGLSASFLLNNLNDDDTIKIVLKLTPALPKIEQLIGGNTWLVQNGNVNPDNGDRHPRTAVGFNQDSTQFFMFVVDGRQPGLSVGMSYKELGDYMKLWGVHQGLNLDGGGSSTMVVRGAIVNSPSDIGGERSVANSLLLISTAPTGPLAYIRINPKELFALGGSSLNLSASGFDQYYNPVSIASGSLVWSCNPAIGSITQSGSFTAAFDTVSGYIYATVGGIIDSALVHLTKISLIDLEPNPVILQPGQSQQMTATAYDNYGNLILLQQTDFQWSVTDDLGSISAGGYFTAANTGSGEIIAEIDTVSSSVPLTVGTSATIVIDDFSDLSGYTLTGTRVDLPQCSFVYDSTIFITEPSSGRLNYSLTTGGTSALYLNKEIQISGTPDRLSIQIYGDGKKHWLRGEFKDVDNEIFLINFTSGDPGIDWLNEWRYIEVHLSEAVPSWVNPNAVLTFPITWTRTYLAETNDSKKDMGAINLDDFRAHFITVGIEDAAQEPENFTLFQNYPNPFNGSSVIKYSLPKSSYVMLKVFNTLGEEIETLVNEEKTAGVYSVKITMNNLQLSSGIYFYQLTITDNEAGSGQGFVQTRKMILLK